MGIEGCEKGTGEREWRKRGQEEEEGEERVREEDIEATELGDKKEAL